MDDEEVWKPIKDHTGYEISNKGRVRSSKGKQPRILKTPICSNGRRSLVLRDGRNGVIHNLQIHRLIAEAFIPNPEGKECVDHIDRDKLNNNISNLRWATKAENNVNAVRPAPASGFRGVHMPIRCTRYSADIRHNGKSIVIGYYDTPEEAHEAYKSKAKELFGEFACTESK